MKIRYTSRAGRTCTYEVLAEVGDRYRLDGRKGAFEVSKYACTVVDPSNPPPKVDAAPQQSPTPPVANLAAVQGLLAGALSPLLDGLREELAALRREVAELRAPAPAEPEQPAEPKVNGHDDGGAGFLALLSQLGGAS